MVKHVVILGKCGPDVDAKALKAVIRFVSDTQPDELVCIEQSIPLLEGLREVYDGPVGVHANNLESRFGATALSESCHHRIAPGWISTAKEDCVEVSRIPGNTALHAVRKYGICVMLGHTGRMGICSHTTGHAGRVDKTVTGMEVGHLMDMKKLRSRIKVGKGDVIGLALATTLREMSLQQGFGMLIIGQDCDCRRIGPCLSRAADGQHVRPECVAIHRGKFEFEGRTWEV
jgi:hypothetical protein